MLVKCKTKNNEPIQIYDPDYLKDLDLKDFGLSDIEEITELDGNLPIYPLNDIILSQITTFLEIRINYATRRKTTPF